MGQLELTECIYRRVCALVLLVIVVVSRTCAAGGIVDNAVFTSPGEHVASVDAAVVTRFLQSNETSFNYSDPTQFSGATQMALVRRTGGSLHFHWFEPLTTARTLYVNGNIVGSIPAFQTEHKLGGLVANTTYFLVLADPSAPSGSQILVASTLQPDAPDPPTALEAMAVSAGYADVEMNLPVTTGGVPLSTWLKCSVQHESDEYPFTFNLTEATISNPSDDGSSGASRVRGRLSGLNATTLYFVSCAVQNVAGFTSPSSTSTIAFTTTAITQPSRCDAPRIQNITGGSITLVFKPPADTGGSRILHYRVYAAVNNSIFFDEVAIASTPVITLYQLETGVPFATNTMYEFRVVAENWAGLCYPPGDTSFLSDSVVVTFPDPSLPPTILPPYVTDARASTLALQIVLPEDMYGTSKVWGYVVQWNAPTDVANSFTRAIYVPVTGFNSFQYALNQLNASTLYKVRVSLFTELGYSAFSPVIAATTGPGALPDAPRSVTVSRTGSTFADIEWDIPIETGGGPLDGYKLYVVASTREDTFFQPSGMVPLATSQGTVQTQITSLAPNTTYNGSIVVRNAFGLFSTVVTSFTFATTSASTPWTPHSLFAFMTTGGMLHFAWSAPVNEGGAGKITYIVEDSTNGKLSILCTNTTSSCKAFGLTANTTYSVSVRAQNHLGSSAPTTPQPFTTTLPTPPSSIRALSASTVSSGAVVLQWTAPQDFGGVPAVEYRIERNGTIVGTTTSTTYTDCSNVLAGQIYVYAVYPKSIGGPGPVSFSSARTGAVQPPGAPTISVALAKSRSIVMGFQLACDTGGSTGVQGSFSWQVVPTFAPIGPPMALAPTASNFTLSGLEPGRRYRVMVWASSAGGTSPTTALDVFTHTGIPASPGNVSLSRASSYDMELIVSPPRDFPDDLVDFVLMVTNTVNKSVAWRVVSNAATSAPQRVVLPNLNAATEYAVEMTAQSVLGASSSTRASFSTLPSQPGYVSFQDTSLAIMNGTANVLVVLNRLNGSLGNLLVTFAFTSTPVMYPTCSCPDSCVCDFSSTRPATTPPSASVVFSPTSQPKTILLRTWNSAVVDQVSHILGITLTTNSTTAGPNTSCQVLLYGNPGNVSSTATTYTILDTAGAFQIPLVRRNGSSGNVLVALTSVSRIDSQVSSFADTNPSIPFGWTSSIVLTPRQVNGSFGLFNIVPSASYMPFGRRFLLQFETNATQPRTPFQVIVTLTDDPIVLKTPLPLPNDLTLQSATGSLLSISWQRPTYPPGLNFRYNTEISGPYKSAMVDPRNLTWSVVAVDVPKVDFYNLVPQSVYFVRVAARNDASVGPRTQALPFWTTAPVPAGPPVGLNTSRITGGSMAVAWRAPLDTSGLPVESYLVKVYVDATMISSTTTSAATTSFVISNLAASTWYTVLVGANTKFPAASFATISERTVVGGTIPTSPSQTLLQQATGGSLALLIIPSDDNGGYFITKYTLYISPAGKNNFTIACSDNSAMCNVNRLTPKTSYDVYATTTNSVGTSPPGPTTTFRTTALTVPSAPLYPQLVAVTATVATIQWTPPLDLGGTPALTGYQVRRQTFIPELNVWSPYDVAMTAPLTGQATQARVTNLAASTLYLFSIVALNAISPCVSANTYNPSVALMVQTTTPTRPQPPTNIVVWGTSGSSLSLTWSPPIDDGGSRISGYAVFSPTAGRLAIVSDPVFTQFGLKANTTYSFWITAISSLGESVASANATGKTTTVSAPSAPRNFVQVDVTGGRVTLVWDLPADDGGGAIFGYNLYRDDVLVTSLPLIQSYVDRSGLQTNQTYVYAIAALNVFSEGGRSVVTATTNFDAGVPQPPILTVLEVTGGMVTVRATLPSDMGGAPFERLLLRLLDAEFQVLQQLDSYSLDSSFYGLRFMARYTVQCQVVTAGGVSPAAELPVFTTTATTPTAPQAPAVGGATGGSIQLWLFQSLDQGGEPATVILSHKWLGTDKFERIPFQVSESQVVTIKGLDASTAHQFWTNALNSAGESWTSPTVIATTTELSLPEQVLDTIQIVGKTYRSLIVAWASILDNGGDSAVNLSYNVSIVSSKGTSYMSTPQPALTIDGLTALTSYTLQVQAINSVGRGPWSAPQSVTTDNAVPGDLQFIAQSVQVLENATTLVLTVVRTSGTANTISCTFAVTGGSATTPSNFVPPETTSLTFVDGVTTQTIDIQIVNNDAVDSPRYFDVALTGMTSETGALGANQTCRVTILDDGDAGVVSFRNATVTILESQARAVLELRRSPTRTSGPVTIQATFREPQTAVTFLNSIVSFASGQTAANLTLVPTRDSVYTFPFRSAIVDLTIASESAGDVEFPSSASVFIVDDVDVSAPDDAGYAPTQLETTGGRMIVQVPPPRHVGGLNQSLVMYRVTMTDANGQVVASQTQDTAEFSFGGLNFSTRYTFSSTVTNRAGLASNGSGAVSLTTGPMSLPSPPTNFRVVGATGGSIDVCWALPQDSGGIPISGFQVRHFNAVVYNGSASCAHIANLALQANATFSFNFSAVNLVGVGRSVSANLSTATNASLPSELGPPSSVVQAGGDSLVVQVPLPGDTGGLDILRYVIYINTTNSTDQTTSTFTEFAINATGRIVLAGLTAETLYAVKYTAWNALGVSNMSSTFHYTTGVATIPTEPRNLQLDRSTPTTGACIPLIWDPPASTGGIPLAEYHLYATKLPTQLADGNISLTNATMNLTFTRVFVGPATTTATIVCGFEHRTPYAFKALAYNAKSFCFGSVNDMPFSPLVGVSTSNASVPSRPDPPRVVSTTGGVITLAWATPRDTGGTPLRSFDVYLIASNGSMLVQRVPGQELTCDVNGLDELRTYEFQLTATNDVGPSAPSWSVLGRTTAVSSPSKPLNLTLTSRTGGTILLSWQPPQDSGGRPIASYFVYRDSVKIGDSQGTTTFLDQANLIADTAYSYFITAYTNVASGRQSDAFVTKTGPGSLPGVCTDISVEATGGSLSVAWLAPQNSGGLPILSYTSVLLLGQREVARTTTTRPTTVFNLLQFGTAYLFVVNATNAVGSSAAAQAVLRTTNVSVPGPPASGPTFVTVFGGNATLSMDLPRDTGGETSRLSMSVFVDGRLVLTVPAFGNGVIATIFGLTATTSYQLSYACSNVAGLGAIGPPVVLRTGIVNAPGFMLAPTVTSTTSRTVQLSWIPPTDTGGSTVLRFEIDVAGASRVFANATSGTVAALQPETTYSCRIRAVSMSGGLAGLWSPIIQISTAPASAGRFTFGVATTSVLKNATTFALPVYRVQGSVGAVTVTLTTPNKDLVGTQVVLDPENPTATQRTIAFDDGTIQVNVVLGIINDRVYTADGVPIPLRLVDPTNFATLSSEFNATTLVLQDAGAAGQINFVGSNVAVLESASTLVLPLARVGGTSTAVNVLVRSVVNTNGAPPAAIGVDFRLPTTPIRFEDGVYSANVSIIIRNNNIYSFPNPAFTLQLVVFSGGAVIGDNSTIAVTLLDDGDASPPSPPALPTIVSVTGGAVEIALVDPVNKGYLGADIVKYQVTVTNTTSTVVDAGAKTMWVGGLGANTTYELFAQAANDAFTPTKFGGNSPTVVFATGSPSMNGPATALQVTSATGGSLTFAWSLPLDTGGVPIRRYRVKWTDDQGIVKTAETVTATYTIFQLRSNSSYIVQVQCNNDVPNSLTQGWGPYSAPQVYQTGATSLPSSPILVEADPVRSGGSVTMTWSSPLDTGGEDIARYIVLAKLSNESSFYVAPNQFPVDATRYKVSGLYANTVYNFRVVAQNARGDVVLPGVFNITNKALLITSSADVGMSWVRPGAALMIGDYYFTVGRSVSKNTIPITTPHMFASLTNAVGVLVGEASSPINITTAHPTLPETPDMPVITRATGGAAYGYLLSPVDTGGVRVLGYRVYLTDMATNKVLEAVSTNDDDATPVAGQPLARNESFQIIGLKPRHTYRLWGLALNSFSSCTNELAPTSPTVEFQTTDATIPDPPDSLAVVLATGAGFSFSWSPPADTGGVNIIQYTLQVYNESTQEWRTVYANASTSCRVAKLASKTSYRWRMLASNEVGTSEFSQTWTYQTSVVSPTGPCRAPIQRTSTGGMVSVTWDPPDDNGGSDVTSYILEYGDSSAGPFQRIMTKTTSADIYGLRAVSKYTVKVMAVNRIGAGEAGDEGTMSTGPPSAPDVPEPPIITESSGGALVISMKPPLDIGGVDPATLFYEIYANGYLVLNISYIQLVEQTKGESTNQRRLQATQGSGVTVGGLDSNKKYRLSVSASSPAGSSPRSTQTEMSTSPPTVPGTPSAPTVIQANGGSLLIGWSSPADEGGASVRAFQLFNQASPATPVCQGLVWQCTVSGLLSNSAYEFYVVAQNSVGDSPPSKVLEAKTTLTSTLGPPQRMRLVSLAADGRVATIAWSPPLDTGGLVVSGYSCTAEKTSDLSQLTVTVTSTQAQFTQLVPGATYTVTCITTNIQFDTSTASGSVRLTTPSGNGAPMSPSLSCVSASSLSLTWPPLAEAASYILYRDGVWIYSGQATAFWDAGLTISTSYSYQLSYVTTGQVESANATAAFSTGTSATPTCAGQAGYIHQGTYQSSWSQSWVIAPTSSVFTSMELQFTRFDVECDHDLVTVEYPPYDGTSVLWSGGCTRANAFSLHSTKANAPVKVTISSDRSVQKGGFDLFYQVDTDPPPSAVPSCPQAVGQSVCNNHGVCTATGACRCNLGFTGEDCSNYIMCCTDPTVCHDQVCEMRPQDVILVSATSGDDIEGTGEMMGVGDRLGTAAKPFATLTRALRDATNSTVVLLYPGVYADSGDCSLSFVQQQVDIRGFLGSDYVFLDCATSGMTMSASNASIRGVTVQNVDAATPGAAFNIQRSEVTLTDVKVRNCRSSAEGGGIFSDQSVVTLTRSSITNCSASQGGGVFATDSRLTLSSTRFSSNQATDGGGVFVTGASHVLGDSAIIAGNQASNSGGGVVARGTVHVSGITVTSNTAKYGGGASLDGQIHLVRVALDANRASRFGGGLYTQAPLVLTTNDVVVSNNVAVEAGGGLYIHNTTCSVVGVGCVFQRSQAQDGAGVYVHASKVSLDGVTLTAGNATSGRGGGIAMIGSELALSRSSVDGNFARIGGGLAVMADSQATLVDVTVVNNMAKFGGGMSVDTSSVMGGVIKDNLATEGGGGVLLTDGSISTAQVTSCDTLGHGGGVFVGPSTFNAMTDVQVSDSTSSGNGGGIYCENTTLALTNVHFVGNNASQHGGGLFLRSTTVTGRCHAAYCSAAVSGGGVSIAGAVGIDAVDIESSKASVGGGFSAIDSTFVVRHTHIVANSAVNHGGGVYIRDCQGAVDDWTVRGNSAGINGGGLIVITSAVVHNTLMVTENSANNFAGGMFLDGSALQPKVPGAFSSIQKNRAYNGGNVGVTGPSELVGFSVTNGLAFADGGGMYLIDASCQLDDLSIEGNTAINNGGGLFVKTSVTTLSNTLLKENAAVYGGGIGLMNANVQHANATVILNQAGSAGGMYMDGTSSFHSNAVSSISQNTVCMTSCGLGGNIAVFEFANASISGVIASNGTSLYGGGLFVFYGGNAILTNVTLDNNAATFGGAFSAFLGTTTSFTNCSFTDNAASTSGGAIYVPYPVSWSEVSTVKMVDCRVVRNVAQHGMGGAIYMHNVKYSADRVLVEANRAIGNDGGGLYLTGASNATLHNTQVVRNAVLPGYSGGGISVVGRSSLVVVDSEFEGPALSDEDTISKGGLIHISQERTKVVLQRTHLQVGQADFGGGIYVSDGRIELADSTISNCKSLQFGGALYLTSSATAVLTNATVVSSDANFNGGGIYIEAQSTLTAVASTIENNYADDQGGGIFVAIGNGNACVLRGCVVRRNVASGLGSALFASRDSQVSVSDTLFESNGGVTFYGYSEGGPVYFDSSYGTLTNSTFAGNIASYGGAMQIQNTAQVEMTGCLFTNNTGLVSGGAIHQRNGNTRLVDMEFKFNRAPSGGAVYLEEAAATMWTNVSFVGNGANTGGGTYIGGTSTVAYTGGFVHGNSAKLGGGVFAGEDATLSAASIRSRANIAQHSGGAFYLNDTVNVHHTDLEFDSNDAPLGRDIFWRYKQSSPSYSCAKNCHFDDSRGPSIATDPMDIEMGWWPAYATSGVPMTTSKLDNITTVWDNSTNKSVPWPTILVVDFYGHRSILDQSTVCRVYKKVSELVKIMFLPNSQVVSSSGFVTFQNAEVQTDPKEAPFEMAVECRLYNRITRTLDLTIKVQPCDPGYMLQTQKCVQCAQGTFSLDGLTCHPCPLGANCETIQTVGTGQLTSGVAFPSTQRGYFLADAPPTSLQKLCDIASYFPSGDPCPGGTEVDRLDRMRRCMNDTNFKLHWDENRVFTCSSGFMFYSCPVTEACKGSISKSEVAQLGRVCQEGYTSPLCGSCERNYQKMQDGTCIPCDEVSRSAFYGYVTIPTLLVMAGLYAIFLYLHRDTDKVLMAQARAATEDKQFLPHASKSKLLKLEASVNRVRKAIKAAWKKVVKKATPKKKLPDNLFGIQQIKLPTIEFSAEKFKILLAFFQIFSNLKDTYQISWPQDVAYLMAFVSKFNFGFMSIPHLDCMIDFSFYGDFRLTLATAAISFVLLYLTYRWGVFVYKRKLHKIPRHCTLCGLPNTDISTTTRVSAIRQFAMEIERDRNQSKLKKLFSRFLLSIEKDEVKNPMPTYLSNHATCPTTERVVDATLREKILRTNLRLWQARVKLRLNFRTYTDKCMKIFFWLALFMYPAVSQKILNMFNCTQVGQGSFLVSDMTLSCTDGYWYSHAIVAVVGIVVWVIGVPFYCWSILFQERMAGVRIRMRMLKDNKHEELRQKWIAKMKADYKATGKYWHPTYDAFANMLLHEYMKKRNMELPSTIARAGFIYAAYKDPFWFFEIVDLVRKLLLNGVLSFADRGSVNQIVLGMMIIFAYMAIILAMQPYKNRSNTLVASLAQLQLFVTLFAGLLIKMNVGKAQSLNMEAVSNIIIITNIAAVSLTLLEAIREKYLERKKYKLIRFRKYQNDIRYHVQRLWWRAMSYAVAEVYLDRLVVDPDVQPSFRVVLELARRQKAANNAAIPEDDMPTVTLDAAEPTPDAPATN